MPDELRIRQPDGEVLGPADRATLMSWAEAGRISPNALLCYPDGREESVMLDDTLGRAIDAADKDAVKHPGRRELIAGAVITGAFLLGMLVTALAPKLLMLGPGGKGHYGANMGYWWIILIVGLATGATLVLRGLREQRRAALVKRLERD